MDGDNDITPASRVRIHTNNPAPVSDALYSSPFERPIERVDAPPLRPVFHPTEPPPDESKSRANDSVSTGTFGNMVRKVNREASLKDRVARARQRIRFNLLKVGPRRKTSERCEAWRKYLF
jgi:hypothetical protein